MKRLRHTYASPTTSASSCLSSSCLSAASVVQLRPLKHSSLASHLLSASTVYQLFHIIFTKGGTKHVLLYRLWKCSSSCSADGGPRRSFRVQNTPASSKSASKLIIMLYPVVTLRHGRNCIHQDLQVPCALEALIYLGEDGVTCTKSMPRSSVRHKHMPVRPP